MIRGLCSLLKNCFLGGGFGEEGVELDFSSANSQKKLKKLAHDVVSKM
jgi:hypothetical protein